MTTEKEAPPAGEGIAYDDRFCAICGSARHDWRSFVIGEGDSARICDSCLHDLGCDIEWRERAEKAESDLHREAERRAEDVAKIEQDYKLMLDYSHDESADLGKKLDAAEAECDALRAQLAAAEAERDEARAALSEAKAALSDVSGALVDAGMAIGLATGFGESVRILAGQRDKLQRDFDYQSKEFDEADSKRRLECDDLKNQIKAAMDGNREGNRAIEALVSEKDGWEKVAKTRQAEVADALNEVTSLRAQLATLSRCARAYLSAVDHYLRSLVKQRVMHQPHDDVAAQVMNLAEKELLAALDSSGGEGEKAK